MNEFSHFAFDEANIILLEAGLLPVSWEPSFAARFPPKRKDFAAVIVGVDQAPESPQPNLKKLHCGLRRAMMSKPIRGRRWN